MNYKLTLKFYEQNINGEYEKKNPHIYVKDLGLSRDTRENIESLIKQAIEIEDLDNTELMCTRTLHQNDAIVSYNTFFIKSDIQRTTTPSSLIEWPANKTPDIFEINWDVSSFEMFYKRTANTATPDTEPKTLN